MSEDDAGLDPIDVATEPGAPAAVGASAVSDWPVGWYADPWTAGQYRFWNGQAWTRETHRSGPAGAYAGTSAWSSAPVDTAGGYGAGQFGTGQYGAGQFGTGMPPTYPSEPRTGGRGPRITAIVAGLVVLVLLSGAIGYSIESHSRSKSSPAAASPPASTLPPGNGSIPNASGRAALARLVVQQADVGGGRIVVLIPNGNRTTQPTLDLCNGSFASEKLRVSRLQVAEIDSGAHPLLSTEAVEYRNPAATATAFKELGQVRAACPKGPVKSPVGEGTATTAFNPAPDHAWPQTASVERLAYSFSTTQSGTTSSSIAVYLRRGRVLLGVYFPNPKGAQPSVAGKTSIRDIVGVFAQRLAALPASVVSGSG